MKVIKNKKYAGFSIAAIIIVSTLLYIIPPHMANSSAEEYSGTDSASGDWVWQVNVQETLSMTVTPNSETNTGDTNKFLRNKIGVSVSTNNGQGYTVGMTTSTANTALTNTAAGSATLPTMSTTSAKCVDANCAAFPANFWGYSLDDTSNTGTYRPMVGVDKAPITVLSNATNGSGTQDVFFGAKADGSKDSGTYKGTVIFTVTTETKGEDLGAPAGDPGQTEGPSAEPSTSPSNQPSAVTSSPSTVSNYSYTTGSRIYRSTATSVAEGTTTGETSDGNVKKRSTASDFVSPLGVNEQTYSTTNVQRGSVVTTVLMAVALGAAGVGIFFFILAKKRDEEEDGDEIQQV